MSEVFFILTVIYAAYVIYVVIDDEKHVASSKPVEAETSSTVKTPSVAPDKITAAKEPASAKKETISVKKPAATKAPPSEPIKSKMNQTTAAPKVELRTVVMKNLKTGEEAKVANNYRMVKRWIKEALVEEGLLDKIYKNTELDDTNKAKVAEALSIIKTMDKYKP